MDRAIKRTLVLLLMMLWLPSGALAHELPFVHALRHLVRVGFFRLTSYTGGDPAQETGMRTASGLRARFGLIAVPFGIPLGTRFYIPGYGMALAADHGAAIWGKHLDLCFGLGGPGSRAYDRARRWGTRIEAVYLVK